MEKKRVFVGKFQQTTFFLHEMDNFNVCSYVYRMMEEGKTTFSTLFDNENKHIHIFFFTPWMLEKIQFIHFENQNGHGQISNFF